MLNFLLKHIAFFKDFSHNITAGHEEECGEIEEEAYKMSMVRYYKRKSG